MTHYYKLVTNIDKDGAPAPDDWFLEALHDETDKDFELVKFESHLDHNDRLVYVALVHKMIEN